MMFQPSQQSDGRVFTYKQGLKKTSPGLMSYLKYVDLWLNRPLAGIIVRLVFNTRITPNQITLVSLCIGLSAAAFFAFGRGWSFILGGVLLQLSSIIDGADGMLARSKGLCSRFGAYFDLFCDRYIDFFSLCGLAIGSYRFGYPLIVLVVGILGAGLYCLEISQFYLLKAYLNREESGETGEARAVAIWVIFVCSLLRQIDLLIYSILLATLLLNLGTLICLIRARRSDSGDGA